MGTVCKCFLTVALLLAKKNSFKEPYRPLIQVHKCLLHTIKKQKQKKRIINCSFSLRCVGTLSFLRRLINYSSIACGHICMWMQLHCVYSDGSERKYSGSFSHTHALTHSHTLSCHFRHRALWSHRGEKGRKNERRAWAVSHQKRVTVVLFSCFLLSYWHPRLIAAASAALLFGYHTPRVRTLSHRSRAVKAEFMAQLFPLTCLLFDCTRVCNTGG